VAATTRRYVTLNELQRGGKLHLVYTGPNPATIRMPAVRVVHLPLPLQRLVCRVDAIIDASQSSHVWRTHKRVCRHRDHTGESSCETCSCCARPSSSLRSALTSVRQSTSWRVCRAVPCRVVRFWKH
jgi:hypothetical protein